VVVQLAQAQLLRRLVISTVPLQQVRERALLRMTRLRDVGVDFRVRGVSLSLVDSFPTAQELICLHVERIRLWSNASSVVQNITVGKLELDNMTDNSGPPVILTSSAQIGGLNEESHVVKVRSFRRRELRCPAWGGSRAADGFLRICVPPPKQMTIEIQPTHAMQIAALEITSMRIALQVRHGMLLPLWLLSNPDHLAGRVWLAVASEHRLRFLAVRCSQDCGSPGDPRRRSNSIGSVKVKRYPLHAAATSKEFAMVGGPAHESQRAGPQVQG
jgi:hypothetical protein